MKHHAYMVERYWPGVTRDRLVAGLTALDRTSDRIAHVRSVLIPKDEAVFCLFEGPSALEVADANRRAGMPVERVVEAVEITLDLERTGGRRGDGTSKR